MSDLVTPSGIRITLLHQVECWMCRNTYWTSNKEHAETLKPCCGVKCESDLIRLRHDKHWD